MKALTEPERALTSGGPAANPIDVAAVLTTWRVTADGGVDLLDPDGEVVARLSPDEAAKLCAVLERRADSVAHEAELDRIRRELWE